MPNRSNSELHQGHSLPQYLRSDLNSGILATHATARNHDDSRRLDTLAPPSSSHPSSSSLFNDRCVPLSLHDTLPSSLSSSHHSNQQQSYSPTTLPPPSYASQPQSPQAPSSQFAQVPISQIAQAPTAQSAQGQFTELVEASKSLCASRSPMLLRPPLPYTPRCALLPRDSGLPPMTGLRRSRISDRLCCPEGL